MGNLRVEFYDNLKTNFEKIPGVECYTGNLMKEHLSFRWGGLSKYHYILEEIERKKILQGIFQDYQFFIRLVKRPEDITEKFGQIVVEELAEADPLMPLQILQSMPFEPESLGVRQLPQ